LWKVFSNTFSYLDMKALTSLNTLHHKMREHSLTFDDCFSISTATDPAELEELFREKAIQIRVIHSFYRPGAKVLPELQQYCDDCGIQPVNLYDWGSAPEELCFHIFTLL
jgi:hypothetical protein